MGLTFDHLVVMAETLDEGVEFVADSLGVDMGGGGQHPDMGTWNRVMALGAGEYLEVIAVDPQAAPPGRARWFGLDEFSGPPRLGTWVCRSSGLAGDLVRTVPEVGVGMALSRGDFSWIFALCDDGRLPFGGAHPSLIEWTGPHPRARMDDVGLRLAGLTIRHPDRGLEDQITRALALDDPRLSFETGSLGLSATIMTPQGMRRLG